MGSKKHPTCLASLLQNELNSDVARFAIHIKPLLQQIRLLKGLNMGGKNAHHRFSTCFAAMLQKKIAPFLPVLRYRNRYCYSKPLKID